MIALADAREWATHIDVDPARAVVITDPVWPNAPAGLFDVPDPAVLFAAVAARGSQPIYPGNPPMVRSLAGRIEGWEDDRRALEPHAP